MAVTNEKQVEVTVQEGSLSARVTAGQHTFWADEPEGVGGNNLGPDPYDLLLGALGACTAMTIRMYANRKQWPLKKITIRLFHRKVYSQDCINCEQDSAKLDHIDKMLILEGNLTGEQMERLKVIADKCPLHKTLMSSMSISSFL